MNTQDYISSGLLEAYVLGSLPENEATEVVAAMEKYPEVLAEIASIEDTLLQLAQLDAVKPPAQLQNEIWAAIEAQESKNDIISDPVSKPATKTIPLVSGGGANTRSFHWAHAAVWIGLIGSVAANAVLWNKSKENSTTLVYLQKQVDTMNHRNQYLASIVESFQKEAEMMASPAMQPIVMQSTNKDHPMAATIYWNKQAGQAYVSIQKLPPPPSGKQYQLWVIATGKPVDLGVLANDLVDMQGMKKIDKLIPEGQAFAISLEKEGGVPSPSMDQIFVMGKAI